MLHVALADRKRTASTIAWCDGRLMLWLMKVDGAEYLLHEMGVGMEAAS